VKAIEKLREAKSFVLLEGKQYHFLIGIHKDSGKGEMIFGDYDKSNVRDEKDAYSDEYKKLRIVTMTDSAEDEKKAIAQAKELR